MMRGGQGVHGILYFFVITFPQTMPFVKKMCTKFNPWECYYIFSGVYGAAAFSLNLSPPRAGVEDMSWQKMDNK